MFRTTVVLTAAAATIAVAPVLAFAGSAHAGRTLSSKHSLHVVETDYHIALSSHSGKPGTYTVTDVNNSPKRHGLVVNGPGQDNTLLGFVKPHKTAHFTVKLSKGKYDIFCPIQGHKMLGMNTHLTIK